MSTHRESAGDAYHKVHVYIFEVTVSEYDTRHRKLGCFGHLAPHISCTQSILCVLLIVYVQPLRGASPKQMHPPTFHSVPYGFSSLACWCLGNIFQDCDFHVSYAIMASE